MSKAGLDRKRIAAIIGHKSKLSAEASYLDWDTIEEDWLELCEQRLTCLTERVEIGKEVVDTEARRELENIRKLLIQLGLSHKQVKQLAEGELPELEDKSKENVQT